MTILYGAFALAALFLFFVGAAGEKGRDPWLPLLLASVFCAELGFFLVSISKTLTAALWANRLCYLGQVFLPLFLMLLLLRLCSAEVPRGLPVALAILGAGVLALTMSPGLLPWYYADVGILIEDGVTHITREYGPLHLVYYFYLLGYLIADTIILVVAIRSRRMRLPQQSWLLVGAVYVQVAIWLIEQFLPRGFEYLSISYVVAEVFILLVNSMLRTIDRLLADQLADSRDRLEMAQNEIHSLRAEMEARQESAAAASDEEELSRRTEELARTYELTERESQVMRLLVEGKSREEAAQELHLSKATIKKYISSLYRKLGVNSRMALAMKIGGR